MGGWGIRRWADAAPADPVHEREEKMSETAEPSKTVTACVLIIGNEILSGRIQDANLACLAKGLSEVSARLREAPVSPDDLRGGAKMLSRAVSCGVGEGTIAAELAALQHRYADLEIGSYPYFRRSDFGTTLVVRGTDVERIAAAVAELTALIRKLGGVPQEA